MIWTMLQGSPICPHCGYRHDDAWEWKCDQCNGEFDCERVVDVSYTTKPARAAIKAAEENK